jgi:Ni/Fe-hydrogenase subunit HybB-like protein
MIFFSKVASPVEPGRNLTSLFVILILMTMIGISFGLHAMYAGHDHVFGTSREVPWGILITPYVFFACLSTGLCILSSLGQVFRIKTFVPLVNRAVFLAIIAMASGLLSIGLEIESPWRMAIYGALSPNPLSNIWWKSSIYTLFLLLMSFNFLFLLLDKTAIARIFAIGALLAITCGNLNMNSDMALLGARGFWAENYMPLFFLTVSTLLACNGLSMFVWLSHRLHGRQIDGATGAAISANGKLTLVLLIGILSFAAVKMLGGFSTNFTDNPEAMQLLVRGDFALNFWLGEIVLTGCLPLILCFANLKGENIGMLALAGLSSSIGIFITLYDLIIVGQLIPHYSQYNLVGMPEFYSYTPSLHEYIMVLGTLSFFGAAYIIGEIAFNSAASEK